MLNFQLISPDRVKRLVSLPSFQVTLLLVLLVLLVLLSYWPGLSGEFLLDDVPNLHSLADASTPNNLSGAINYVFSGTAGPGGRPLSLATYLLNDNAWPSDPSSFKFTNLLIHALNGLLVLYFTLLLLPSLPTALAKQPEKHLFAAGICALLWSLHPLQISSVLYVIQRMTELSATFMLVGLIAYLKLRPQIAAAPRSAYIQLTLSVAISGLLAILAKENGILLLLYIFLLEKLILQKQQPIEHRYWNLWQRLVIQAPLLLLIAYIAINAKKYAIIYEYRGFTLWERLLTEARVLTDYLFRIFIPKLGGGGLYHDDYVVSRGLFEPISTVFALILIFALFAFALKARHRFPMLCFALLWFFASHILESSVLPLEIYFEHRNYLAIFGVTSLITVAVYNLPVKIKPIANVALVLLIGIFAGLTRFDATTWGKPNLAPFIWSNEHPSSIRAAQDAASAALRLNEKLLAAKIIAGSLQRNPNNSGLILQNMLLSCLTNSAQNIDFATIQQQLRQARFSNAAIQVYEYLSVKFPLNHCPNLDISAMAQLTQALSENKQFIQTDSLHAIYYYLGMAAFHARDLNASMQFLDKASEYQHHPSVPLTQSQLLISAGLYRDAKRYLDIASDYDQHTANIMLRNSHKKTIESLADYLDTVLNQQNTPPNKG